MNSVVLIDANVIVRFLTGEPADMALRARALWEEAERTDSKLSLPTLVVAESTWVLRSFYRWPRGRIAEALLALMDLAEVEAPEHALVAEALTTMATANVSFVDAYLDVLGRNTGTPVASFDRNFARLGVEWVEPTLSNG